MLKIQALMLVDILFHGIFQMYVDLEEITDHTIIITIIAVMFIIKQTLNKYQKYLYK
jgi:hypothetical protein